MSQVPSGFPAPDPAAVPLAYAYAVNRRPGIVTALGVISIVVASLSIIASGMFGLGAGALLVTLQITAAMNESYSDSSSVSITITDDDLGLEDPQRTIVLDTVTEMYQLTDVRRQHLRELLSLRGQEVFWLEEGQRVTKESVREMLEEASRYPRPEGKTHGADLIITPSGKVEVHDDRAVYLDNDSSPRPIIAVAGKGVSGPGVRIPLPNDQIADVVLEEIIDIGDFDAGMMTDVQSEALRKFLAADPSVVIDELSAPNDDVYSAEVSANGDLIVEFWDSSVRVEPDGHVTHTRDGEIALSRPALLACMFESVASLGLAVYLLISGIVTLRHSLRGRSLHWIYVWLKIPLVAIFAFGWLRLVDSLDDSMKFDGANALIIAVTAAGISYPLALLFALRSAALKGYYSTDLKP